MANYHNTQSFRGSWVHTQAWPSQEQLHLKRCVDSTLGLPHTSTQTFLERGRWSRETWGKAFMTSCRVPFPAKLSVLTWSSLAPLCLSCRVCLDSSILSISYCRETQSFDQRQSAPAWPGRGPAIFHTAKLQGASEMPGSSWLTLELRQKFEGYCETLVHPRV